MALSLTTADERRLAAASTALLSALDYESEDAWCQSVIDEAKALVGSDGGAVLIPVQERLMARADAGRAVGEYVPRTRPLDERLSFLHRAVQLGSYDRQTLFRPYFDRYLASSYYNEWIIPNRLFDTIGLAVAPGRETRVGSVGQLLMYDDRPLSRLGTRGPALLRLILPSFRAAVHAWRTHARQNAALARTLDRLREGLMLCDRTGRPVHCNAALERILADDPEARRVRTRMEELARLLVRYRITTPGGPPPPAFQRLVTVHASYAVHISCSESGELLPGLALLVALEKTTPDWPSGSDLVRRFRLTPAEARVALLLARGKTNAEIARELTVSPATARNHTARVREKLGVDSRAKVAAVLLGRSAPGNFEGG